MIWRTFSTVTAISLILSIPVYGTQLKTNANNNLETETSTLTPNAIMAQTPNQPTSEPHQKNREEHRKKLWEQLNLTPEQSQQIETIEQQSQTEAEPLRQELQQAHEQMRSLLASNANTDELRQQHEKMQTLHQQLGDQRFETMLQIREVLTPEQRTQMAELMEQKRGRSRGDKRF